jgi:hypothetical protein
MVVTIGRLNLALIRPHYFCIEVNENDEELPEKQREQIFAVAANRTVGSTPRHAIQTHWLGLRPIISLQFEADL